VREARKLTRAAYALEAGFAATDYRAALTFLLTQVRARSLFVIFTNLLDASLGEVSSRRRCARSCRAICPSCVMMRDTDVEALAK
jgi:hypothetical protein